MAEPNHPDQDVAGVAGRIVGVDLSGGGTTIGNDQLTTGADALTMAYTNGLAPHPGSPAGQELLKAVLRWRTQQRAQEEAPTPAEVEGRAHRKGFKKYTKRLRKGDSNDIALVKGYATYRVEGGKLTHAGWVRKCGDGR